jgi:hypothetical protein
MSFLSGMTHHSLWTSHDLPSVAWAPLTTKADSGEMAIDAWISAAKLRNSRAFSGRIWHVRLRVRNKGNTTKKTFSHPYSSKPLEMQNVRLPPVKKRQPDINVSSRINSPLFKPTSAS